MMKTTPRLKTTLTVWTTATLWTLSGCPQGEQKEEPDADTPGEDVGSDLGGGEDAGADTGADAGADVGEAAKVTCETIRVSPRTLPVDAEGAVVSWVLECDGELKAESFGDAPTWDGEREREGAPTVASVECVELGGDVHECAVVTEGLNGPAGSDVLGPEKLGVIGAEAEMAGTVRWHEPAAAIQASASEELVTQLPATYAERGMGVRVMEGASAPYVAGAMWNVTLDGIEMFGMDQTSEPPTRLTHDSLDASLKDTIAHGFVTHQREDGADSAWWGFDVKKQQFRLILISHTGEGNMGDSKVSDDDAYSGAPIASVLDVEAGTQEVEGQDRLGLRALVLTEGGALSVLNLLGGGESMNRVEIMASLDLPNASSLTSAQAGFVQGVGTKRALDKDDGHAWLSLDGVKFSLVSLDGQSRISTVDLGTDLELEETFVGEGEGGELFVLLRGEDRVTKQEEVALFQIERSVDGDATKASRLETPEGVDLRPAPSMGEESVWLAEAVEAAGPEGLEGIFTGSRTLGVSVVGGVATMLGRWPWNWRDKLKATALGRWPWDWRERKELRGSLAVVGQWDLKDMGAGGEKTLLGLRPAVPTGNEAQSAPKGLGVQGFTSSGALTQTSVAALTESCAGGCFVPVSDETASGFGVFVGQGASGLELRVGKYGDILIDGVPLEFDLIAPPIVFDRPSGGGMAIAPVDHAQATHGVWSWGEDGKPTARGLLTFDSGEAGSTQAEFVTGGAVHATAQGEEVLVSFAPVEKAPASPDLPSDGYTATSVVLPISELEAVWTARAPVTIDLKGRALVTEDVARAEDGLSAAIWAAAETLPEERTEGAPEATVLATLTPEQAARPVRVRQEGSRLVFETVTGLDGSGALAYEALEGVDVRVDGEGFGGPGVMYSVSADFTGKIKRVRIKKRRVGSGFRALGVEREEEEGGVVYELVSEEITAPDGALAAFGDGPVEISSLGDYNGDGIVDVALKNGDFETLTSGETDTITFTYVMFGDGDGGTLPDGVMLKGDVDEHEELDDHETKQAKNRRVTFVLL